MTLLFYCQHSVGLGHLMRSYALCAELAQRFRVVLVCGGPLPDGIAPPRAVEVVALPPLGVGPDGRFVSHDPRFDVGEAWRERHTRILDTLSSVRPAVVVVELFPFGRAKFAREIVPLLESGRAGGAICACSLRDILVQGRHDQRRHEERAARLVNAHLDAILVHCDARFARLEDTFGPRRRLAVPVHYTGFVAAPAAPGPKSRQRIVVSAGGGLVGEPLLRTAADAQPELHDRTGLPMRLIAGPFCPPAAWKALSARRHEGLEVHRTTPDLAAELREAAASVSQCGYNTALALVRARVPALVVPYATEEEDEQRRRAGRLAELGALRALAPEDLTPSTLGTADRAAPGLRSGPRRARPRRRAHERAAALPPRGRAGGGMNARLRPYVVRQWKALAGAAGSTVVLTAADLAKPWPLALVVDHLLSNRDAPFELTATDWRLLAGVAALTLGIAIAEALAQYLSDFWLQSAGERITHELRVAAYDHLQRLSLGYHQRRQKGDLVTRVTGDATAVGELFSESLGAVVQAGAPGPRDDRRAALARPRPGAGGDLHLARPSPASATSTGAASRTRRACAAATRAGSRRWPTRRSRRWRSSRPTARSASSQTACASAARSGWPRASRSRGCRRASTGSSARCARRARRWCSWPACCAWPPARSAPES